MLTRIIEQNGLLIISIATASLYWYFDSLITNKLITRIVTVLLFVSYGAFTQYLINMCNALKAELNEVRADLTLYMDGFANWTKARPVVALNQQDVEARVPKGTPESC